VVFETQLQSNTGVDEALFKVGLELATERNGGVPPDLSAPVSLQQGAGALLVGVLGDYTGKMYISPACSRKLTDSSSIYRHSSRVCTSSRTAVRD
jgi:hypothetical protein